MVADTPSSDRPPAPPRSEQGPGGGGPPRIAAAQHLGDDTWEQQAAAMRAFLAERLDGTGVPWHFRYLAGRPDRALTHLARAVDACLIVVGTKVAHAGVRATLHELLESSVSVQLAHHQHRPILTVPLSVVAWKASLTWG